MPLQLSLQIAKWLKGFSLIQGQIITRDKCEISYNDQLYFQNGFLIGQLLKSILKSKGFASDALMRIRKIAHISSNQNWRIIKEIMDEIHFQDEIDPHNITLQLVQAVLQFLYEQFGQKINSKSRKKEKRAYLDPASFSINKQLDESYNLLQFFLLATAKSFNIPLQECLGLLVDNCKYFKKIIIEGTNNNGYIPIISFFKLITQNMSLVNRLINQQSESQNSFMNCLGLAVLSQNMGVCDVGCIIIDHLESNRWLEQEGYALLLRSPNQKVLDLLLRKIHPNFAIIFNQEISSKFPNTYIELVNYSKLLKYLHKSLYCKEILELLSLSHYLEKAYEKFQPDNVKKQTKKVKLAAKNLLKMILTYFWGRLGYQQKNRLCFCFEQDFCQSQQQKITTLCFLFEMITELSIRQVQFVKKFYRAILKYFNKGTIDIRNFILSNLTFLYENHPDHFPIGFFLQTYLIALPVQTNDFQLIELLSKNVSLLPEEVLMILKVCTIYYYQQLQAACFLVPINNILKNYVPVQWASQLARQILTKWPTLPIPSFQMLPLNTGKIKFRSIGLKKKQMLQFTELNRYKSILKLLTSIKSCEFLGMYGKLIGVTINRVEKSKIKQMQNTKIFLNNLLAKVDDIKSQLKDNLSKENIRTKSQAHIVSEVSDKLENDSYLQEYDQRNNMDLQTPINVLDQQNQFMKSSQYIDKLQDNPLLPFSQQTFDINERNYSDQTLFQNYQLIYIKNIASKYSNLLKYVSQIYEKSANMEHFLKNLNILNYFEKDLSVLQNTQNRLKLAYDNLETISFKLTIQMALLLFEFKKTRRITIKCIQSFYEVLTDKTGISINKSDLHKESKESITSLNAKIDFKNQIGKKIFQGNRNSQNYFICFEVLSQILKKSIGVHAVEPMSCIISQILPFTDKQSPTKIQKSLEKSKVSEIQLKELQELEKIIENQSRIQNVENIYSTPLRKSKHFPPKDIKEKQKEKQVKLNPSQKWADVQKKIIMRRRQLQGRQKTINQS